MDVDEVEPGQERHVQVSFFTNDKSLCEFPNVVFDVPTTADCENLNTLVNKTIAVSENDWSDKRFEFLVGETFLRTTLQEFIEEYEIETETIVKVECILGVEAPKPLHDLQAPDWVSSVHIANNFIFSTTYSGDVTVWSNDAKETKLSLSAAKKILKCSAIVSLPQSGLNGTEIVVGGENQLLTVYRIESSGLSEKMILRGHERSVECVAVNHDATRAISGSIDTNIKIWNLEESDTSTVFEKESDNEIKAKKRKKEAIIKVPMVTVGGHKDKVTAVAWNSLNKSHAFSSSFDHSVVEWDLELAGEVTRIKGQKSFTSVDVHPTNGLLITSSTDPVPRLYDPRSRDGVMVKQSFIGHAQGWVESVRWSPNDDNNFVSVSTDKTAKMWDVRSSKTSLFDLHGHDDRILCCTWADGLIATGSADCTVKVFAT